MKLLSMDTSTSVASVALMQDDKIIGQLSLNDKNTHSQKLMFLIQELLEMTQCTFEMLDAIAVGVGPGSFTGLRIGVTTAKGLAHGASLPLIEVSSLKALTVKAPKGYPVIAMMDARRDTVFAGIAIDDYYEDQVHIDDIIKLSEPLNAVFFVGEAAVLHQERIQAALGEKAIFLEKHMNLMSASDICFLADWHQQKKYDGIHVSYLRKSQAEREYDERQV